MKLNIKCVICEKAILKPKVGQLTCNNKDCQMKFLEFLKVERNTLIKGDED